jgi:hypothetical protein
VQRISHVWFLRRLTAAAVASLAILPACGSASMPGHLLGTYKVVGQSKSNSCGLGAPNPWTFDVQLSQQQETLYWDWLDGSPLLSGTLSQGAQPSTTITDSATVNADSTDAGLGPCTLDTASNMQIDLGAGVPPGRFTGTLSYSYTPASGATCSDVLTTAGGMYEQLPCTVTYTVIANRQ